MKAASFTSISSTPLKKGWSEASACLAETPGLRRANTLAHRHRRSFIPSQPVTRFFIVTGTKICGGSSSSTPTKPFWETPTIVMSRPLIVTVRPMTPGSPTKRARQ